MEFWIMHGEVRAIGDTRTLLLDVQAYTWTQLQCWLHAPHSGHNDEWDYRCFTVYVFLCVNLWNCRSHDSFEKGNIKLAYPKRFQLNPINYRCPCMTKLQTPIWSLGLMPCNSQENHGSLGCRMEHLALLCWLLWACWLVAAWMCEFM